VLGQQVSALVKAISAWTNCQIVDFTNCSLQAVALKELDKHKTLREFQAQGCSIDGKVLGGRSFLRNLGTLTLAGVSDVDSVFKGLKGSSAIGAIHIESGSVSASGLRDLASCHNLKYLCLIKCPVDSEAIEAIGTIKSLQQLSIIKGQLKPEQIPSMTRLNFIEHMLLDISGWPSKGFSDLAKAVPNANKDWQKAHPKHRLRVKQNDG
jgi:hypothetical protein